jgi:hypothetical protein
MREILTATPHFSNAPSADTYAGIPTTTTAKRPPDTAIEYDPNGGVLLIRKGKCECLYTLAEFPTGWDGRAFVVTRDADGEEYNVFVARNGQDSTCDCAGHTYTSNDPTGPRCKHIDALRHLIETDQLQDPRHDPRVDPWPSPEQLAAEAGMNLPF